MTLREFIEELQKFDPDLELYFVDLDYVTLDVSHFEVKPNGYKKELLIVMR